MGHGSTKMLDLVYGKLDAKELGATISRALNPRGSTLDSAWKNAADSVDAVDAVDSKTR
jgi:hypothetical protein